MNRLLPRSSTLAADANPSIAMIVEELACAPKLQARVMRAGEAAQCVVVAEHKVTGRDIDEFARPPQRPFIMSEFGLDHSPLLQQHPRGTRLAPIERFLEPLRRFRLPRTVHLHAMILAPAIAIRRAMGGATPEVHPFDAGEREAERVVPWMIVGPEIRQPIAGQ